MLNKNIETFIACESEYEDADIVMFGAPFDSTTSFRSGTRFGPKAIRSESFGIETYSPYQDKDLEDINVFDSGNIELPMGSNEKALEMIYERTKIILDDKKIPFLVGGEHLVTFGSFKAVYEKYRDVNIVHFDAHADLRDNYLGVKLSHACVIRRCHDLVGDGKIYQFGIRSGEKQEFIFAKKHTKMNKFDFRTLSDAIAQLKNQPVYFTLDLDVLDPSIFSGTGTPEAGGVTFNELLNAVISVCSRLNIVGMDICELAPDYDHSGVSTAVACKILREMLLAVNNKEEN